MPVETSTVLPALKNIATRLRIDSLRATTEPGSGHPTTCCSAADIVAALFFAEMRYDPTESAASARRSLRAVEGSRRADSLCRLGRSRLRSARRAAEAARVRRPISKAIPTPRLPFVDVATGSLGQGLGAGVGIALNARRIGSDYRTYVLMGDGETAEGSVWEAAAMAEFYKLDSLCGIVDVNGARAEPRRRSTATTWRRIAAAGRASAGTRSSSTATTCEQILDALAEARRTKGEPTVILARTAKGQGRLVSRGRAELARQGAQEGRGARSRDQGARGAVRARARETRDRDSAAGWNSRARNSVGDGGAAVLQARRHGRDARSVRRRAGASWARPTRASSRSTPT